MYTVAVEELRRMLKSIRATIIITVFVTFSYILSTNISTFSEPTTENYSSIRLLVFILGYVFVSISSNNCVNHELETGSIKFILSKIKRYQFILGKFIGIFLFWFICISATFFIISSLTYQINFFIWFMLLCVITYYISFCILLSTSINNSAITNFLGLILGLIFPIVGLGSTLSDKWYCYFRYLFPYEYILKGGIWIIVPLIISIIFLTIAIRIFNKREV